MLTVSNLARRFGLSRSTLLYYESEGLMRPARRTTGNYRSYTDRDIAQLEMICVYRNAGLKLADIRRILDAPGHDAFSVLKRRLKEVDTEIETLRGHQRAILKLISNEQLPRRNQVITKDKWVSIMKASGFSEEDMRRWHSEFERLAPEEHQEFLEFLHIPAGEVKSIRAWSGEKG
jgi:DNA-binding transcriptional MerR regulator